MFFSIFKHSKVYYIKKKVYKFLYGKKQGSCWLHKNVWLRGRRAVIEQGYTSMDPLLDRQPSEVAGFRSGQVNSDWLQDEEEKEGFSNFP